MTEYVACGLSPMRATLLAEDHLSRAPLGRVFKTHSPKLTVGDGVAQNVYWIHRRAVQRRRAPAASGDGCSLRADGCSLRAWPSMTLSCASWLWYINHELFIERQLRTVWDELQYSEASFPPVCVSLSPRPWGVGCPHSHPSTRPPLVRLCLACTKLEHLAPRMPQ